MYDNGLHGGCFETAFGWCAAASDEKGRLVRVWLPVDNRDEQENALAGYGVKEIAKTSAEPAIIRYFAGEFVDFSNIPYWLSLSGFSADLLAALAAIPYGKTVSYAEIASLAGHAGKFRAAGQALRRNPLPLILPCHRVIRSSGQTGGFMGRKTSSLKERMLCMEHDVISSR